MIDNNHKFYVNDHKVVKNELCELPLKKTILYEGNSPL